MIKEIPDAALFKNNATALLADILEKHLTSLEKIRYTAVEKSDTAIQNLIDTAVETYLSTLYKLRNLK